MEIVSHLFYLALSFGFTVYVGQTLYFFGRPFLMECFTEDKVADAVNRLFLVGFYLLNAAFVFIALRYGETALTLEQMAEVVAFRVGMVATVMGLLHFNNLFWCNLIRRTRLNH